MLFCTYFLSFFLLKIKLRKKEKNYSWENKKLNRGLKCKEKEKNLKQTSEPLIFKVLSVLVNKFFNFFDSTFTERHT